ncbi:TetR family transcriptional regulator [Capsulimonas corticalis]|uniref:TetR family transcriptional regulator n=1 Tax=Capsulimonas corticalis TaxID=2219043 RepID=A0A402CTF8_9BACT|nr:TetR family transcriptional regulator [Capsulimonas corticalis]
MSRSDTRERFINTTARLLQERGYAATNMADIVAESGAPKGSLYFHFPGGKEELVAAAVVHSSEMIRQLMVDSFASAKTASEGFDALIDAYARSLAQTDYRAGCPVGTVAVEAPDLPIVRSAVAAVFQSWREALREALTRMGAQDGRADELATFILSIIEGGLAVAKGTQSLEPLESAKREVSRLLRYEGLDTQVEGNLL